MCLSADTYDQLNVPGACDLTVHYIITALKCQSPQRQKIPTDLPQNSTTAHKYHPGR